MRTFKLTVAGVLITCTVLVTAQCSNMPVETSAPATAPAAAVPAIIEDLVAANRIIADQGVVDGYGHVSVRNPDNPDQFFLSRSMAPESVVASDILTLDLDGNVLNSDQNTYQERYIHSEIYRLRPDVNSVVHSHAPSVVPFGTTTVPLRAMFHMSAFIGQGLPIFEIRNAAGMTNMLVSNQDIGGRSGRDARRPACGTHARSWRGHRRAFPADRRWTEHLSRDQCDDAGAGDESRRPGHLPHSRGGRIDRHSR